MSGRDRQALEALYAEFARGNFWAGREVFDAEIEWDWSASGLGTVGGDEVYRGVPDVEAAARDWFKAWDSFATEAEEFIEAGDRIVVLVRRHGRPKGSEHDVETGGADLWTMRDGKALRYKAYDDRDAALDAVGLSRNRTAD